LGALATLQGRFSEAEGFLRTALDISMKNGEKLEILINLNNLGEWYNRQGNYAKALETYQSALDRLKEGDIPKLRTMTLLNIGSTYVNQGRLDEPISQAETIIELDRLKSNTEDDTTALMLLSNAWHKKGAREKAITYVTLAANVYKKKKIVFLEGITKRIIGSIYIEEHKYEDALRAFEDALKLHEKLQDPTWKAGTLQMIGWVYREQGNLHKAIDYLKMARVIYIEMGDDAVPSRRELDHKLFWLYVEEGLSRPKKEH
jgi:tetratricopeptide (TPR) repeat protein